MVEAIVLKKEEIGRGRRPGEDLQRAR